MEAKCQAHHAFDNWAFVSLHDNCLSVTLQSSLRQSEILDLFFVPYLATDDVAIVGSVQIIICLLQKSRISTLTCELPLPPSFAFFHINVLVHQARILC